MKSFFATVLTIVLVAAATLTWFTGTTAASHRTSTGDLVMVDSEGVAAGGYDVVSYFQPSGPQSGNAAYTATRHGATYRFVSESNRNQFLDRPERYLPQYGGFCAWGLATKDKLIKVDPTVYDIVDDKLYLNYNPEVKHKWAKQKQQFIATADRLWTAKNRG